MIRRVESLHKPKRPRIYFEIDLFSLLSQNFVRNELSQ